MIALFLTSKAIANLFHVGMLFIVRFFSPSQTLSTPPHSLLTGPQRVVRVVEVGLGQGNVTLNSTRLLHPYIPTSSRQLRRARIFAVAAKHTLCVISRKIVQYQNSMF